MTAFSLLPTDVQFYDIEELCRVLPSSVTDESASPANVDHQLYASLLELLSCLRVPGLDTHVDWDSGLKLVAVRRLEETGLRYDVVMNTFVAADKTVDMRLGRPAKLPVTAGGVLAPTVATDDVQRGKSRSTVPTAGGFTLDDIQQVLSAANCPLPGVVARGVSGSDTSVDERALKEITAYLQSEVGSNKVPQDPLSRGSDLCAYNAGGGAAHASTVTSRDSSLVVRVIPPAVPDTRPADTRDETRPATDAGGTILVTDSNLPYLQQFLPNLQTVMQSVQSLVRCVPQSDSAINSVANNSQQRSMSLSSLATSTNSDAQLDSAASSHKKRKRSGHSNQSKSDSIAATSLVNSSPLQLKEFRNQSGDLVQTKMEADSVTSTAESGFACSLCSRTFSKRLGLSVHVQRAHGHRRSSDTLELSHDALQSVHRRSSDTLELSHDALQCVQPAEDVNVKNCLMKMSRVDGCATVADVAGCTDVTCMCDGCGELVSGLDAHAAVCVGRQSPAKFVGHDSLMKVDKSDAVPAVSASTAVVEMLQLAEHFLRQHIPTPSVSEQTPSVAASIDQVHLLSPPPYSQADMHVPAAVSCPQFTTNGPSVLAELSASSQPAGKEIVYEGSRMREFVEYQCEACLLTFSSSAQANTHVAHHDTSASVSAYRVYACLSCSLRYRDPRIMRHHVVYLCGGSRHCKQQLYPCSFCPKTFMSADYMQLHVRLRHTGQPVTSSVQCVLPTPPGATSVPSLDQLVSHFRRHPANHAHINQVSATSIMSTGNQESSANHKEPFIVQNKGRVASVVHDLMTDDGCKLVSHQSVVDGRQFRTASAACDAAKSRSSKAKGILYKNVFMQCEGTYYCAVCHADLTGRESKRRHRQLPCGDPKTASYSRRYSYVCPYCSERFPSQKSCRQHQIDECLPLIGVGTAELGVSEHRCPLCPKTCFGFPALKGHIMQAHHLPKEEAAKLLAEHELAVPTCGTLAVDNRQELNGVLSPAMISSPSSTLSTTSSAFVTQTTASAAVHSVYDTTVAVSHADAVESVAVSHADAVESDDDVAEPDQPKELYESVVSDDGHQASDDVARPKRNRKSRSNEFFVMMFRNYPILAKGVSMCRSCAAQLEANATTESHAASCSATAAADVRRSTLFRCTHCTATFWRAKDCRTHQLESCLPAHGIKIERLTEPSVACPMCDVRSYNRSGLMSHMKFRHSLDTVGVRQVMDRCGIRKSVPPAADNIIATTSPRHDCEDGSLSVDDVGVRSTALCDGVMSSESCNIAADMLVDGVSTNSLTAVSHVHTTNDNSDTWRTANMLLQRSSADICPDLNN